MFQKSLSETPLKPDWVSFALPTTVSAGKLRLQNSETRRMPVRLFLDFFWFLSRRIFCPCRTHKILGNDREKRPNNQGNSLSAPRKSKKKTKETKDSDTVSESTASNTELIEFLCTHRVWGENSARSSQPTICVTKRTHRVFRRTHRVCPKTQ